MLYALLLYAEDDALPDRMPDADRKAFYEGMGAFNAALDEVDAFRGAQRLVDVDAATSVRVREDEALVTDGPFAETKESLAGFYLIEVDDLDAALALVKRMPSARIGTVEIRPIAYQRGE